MYTYLFYICLNQNCKQWQIQLISVKQITLVYKYTYMFWF